MLFGLEQIATMRRLMVEPSPAALQSNEHQAHAPQANETTSSVTAQLQRQHRMLMSEGAVLMALLLGGGLWLIKLIRSEIRRSESLESFFAAFAHDLKTSLTSLRLQAESMQEELGEAHQTRGSVEVLDRLSKRLVAETGRVETQLENALMMASPHQSEMILEDLDVLEVLNSLKGFWPQLRVEIHSPQGADPKVRGDRRAWEIIFKNILANAARHGRATQVSFSFRRTSEQWELIAVDDGRGLDLAGVEPLHQEVVRQRLGMAPHRATTQSGSGLGLYIVATLVGRMGGTLSFPPQDRGFSLRMTFSESQTASLSSHRGVNR
jgi:signal transduction histidine kinase